MSDDGPLHAYAEMFHQGIWDGAASVDDMVDRALRFVSPAERETLRVWLRAALAKCTASELKGKLRRADENHWFTSKSAHAFLQATLDRLEADAHVRNPPHCGRHFVAIS